MIDDVIFAKYNQDNCLRNQIVTKVIKKEVDYHIVVEPLTSEAEDFIKTIEDFGVAENITRFSKENDRLSFVVEGSTWDDIECAIDSIEKKLENQAVVNAYFNDSRYQYFGKYEKIFVDLDDYLNAHAHVELEKKQVEEQLNKEKEENIICRKVIDDQKEQIKKLHDELEAITNSKSWALTKPIRDCADVLNKKGV